MGQGGRRLEKRFNFRRSGGACAAPQWQRAQQNVSVGEVFNVLTPWGVVVIHTITQLLCVLCAARRATDADKKALIDKISCFIFDCDGESHSVRQDRVDILGCLNM